MNRRCAVRLMALAPAALYGPYLPARDSGTVQLVVPWPAGGVVDIVARMTAASLAELLGRTIIVVNRAGAGGTVGSQTVAAAAADGNTLLMTSSAMSMNQALIGSRLPFDMSRDLVPISGVASAPQVIVVRYDSEIRSIRDLVLAAKAAPGKLNYASSGNGSPAHMGTELLKIDAGCSITHIPYQGAPAALTATASGEVDFFMSPVPPALALIRAKRLMPVAVTGLRRSPSLPDVPTVSESGYPNFEASQWIGLFAPKGVPKEMVESMGAAVGKVTADPGFRKELVGKGLDPVAAGSESFQGMVSADLKRWTEVVRRLDIRPD